MESDEKHFLEYAAGVFHEISLLEIRKSYRLLSELEPDVIENFIQKYSDFAIFLLNILDQKRSTYLLEKLTDSSLVYIVEEELRTLLIREVGNIARVGGDFAEFTLFLELCDRPGDAARVPDFVQGVMRSGALLRERSQKRFFAALDAIVAVRRERVVRMICERNLFVCMGMLIFASDDVLSAGLDALVERAPDLLGALPDPWFLIRFGRSNYGSYLRPEIFAALPEITQQKLQRLSGFLKQESAIIDRLWQIQRGESPAHQTPPARRKAIVDLVYGLVQRSDPEAVELILQNFEQDGLLSGPDRELIRTVASRS